MKNTESLLDLDQHFWR